MKDPYSQSAPTCKYSVLPKLVITSYSTSDVQKGVFNVNGIDLSNVSGFSLTFDKGLFQLEVTERFSADGTKMRPEN